jgi:hypothetical protein
MKQTYQGVLKYNSKVVTEFKVQDKLQAILKVIRLMTEDFPHTKGEIRDMATGKRIFQCSQRPAC